MTDVQCSIVAVLAQASGNPLPDCMQISLSAANLNCDEEFNVVDVLMVLGSALGNELDPVLDTDGDGCPDACQ